MVDMAVLETNVELTESEEEILANYKGKMVQNQNGQGHIK